jgi:transcriptional regulator with XRE-family HTH domain
MGKHKKALNLSEEIRAAINKSKLSGYELCEQSGVDRAVLSRFLRGERSITLDTADKLVEALELKLVPR